MKVSVVIPTLGRSNVLETCLDSLRKQANKDFEVVIATDKKEKLQYLSGKYPDLKIILTEQAQKGLAPARNAGLSSASGNIVSFIDDDVTIEPQWIDELIKAFGSASDIGGVSGPTLISDSDLCKRDIMIFHQMIKKNLFLKFIGEIYSHFVLEGDPYAVGRICNSGFFSLGSNYPESTRITGYQKVDYLEACNMSFRHDVLNKTGGFSLDYKGVGEWSEPDLAFRVKNEGFKLIFNPKAVVHHHISQQGVFKDRGINVGLRSENFIHFYFLWIKPDNFTKAVSFGFNLLFINAYWFYKFIQTGSFGWLGGLRGTFSGLRSELCRL
ncbi:glycosyltransferase family 2 protein [bacterium]|nr:MAG: glycosyltransferase family 2 protein [bacterium]